MLSDQEPLPPFVGSIALIRRFVDEVEEWLAIWGEQRCVFQFPQASRGEAESFRSCLDDEIEATLELNRKSDYLISGLPRAHYQAPVEWPGSCQPQWVIVEFFVVDLYGQRAPGIIGELSGVRWLTPGDLQRGSAGPPHQLSLRRGSPSNATNRCSGQPDDLHVRCRQSVADKAVATKLGFSR